MSSAVAVWFDCDQSFFTWHDFNEPSVAILIIFNSIVRPFWEFYIDRYLNEKNYEISF